MKNFAFVPAVVENVVANSSDESKKSRQTKKTKDAPKRKVNDFNEVTRQARVIYNRLKRVGFLHWGIDGFDDANLKKKAVMQVLYNLRDEKYSRNSYMKDLRLRMMILISNPYFQMWLTNYGLKAKAKAIAMNIAFEGTSKIESMLLKEVLQSGGFITTEPDSDWFKPIFTDEEIAGQFKKDETKYEPAFKELQNVNHSKDDKPSGQPYNLVIQPENRPVSTQPVQGPVQEAALDVK